MKKDKTVSTDETKAKKPGKVLNTVINVVLIVAIVIAALCTYVSFVSTSGNGAPNIFGFQFLSIQTDSMYPTLQPGDLIIDREVTDVTTLEKRDIITYWTTINGERVLNTHRIEEIYDAGDFITFETKGDKNTLVDTLMVHEAEVVGVYKARIPGVGKVFDYLQTSVGFLVVVVIPVFIFFLYHLVQFFRILFEYQNVKNRIKYEQERDKEDADRNSAEEELERKNKERAEIEAELREKLRAELLESMAKEQEQAKAAEANTAPETKTAPEAEKNNNAE